jgi:hypothetical protein
VDSDSSSPTPLLTPSHIHVLSASALTPSEQILTWSRRLYSREIDEMCLVLSDSSVIMINYRVMSNNNLCGSLTRTTLDVVLIA